jgi:hypothetical protein
MPDWVVEGDTAILLLLALVGIVSGLLWWHTRKRHYLAIAAAAVTAFAALYVVDRLVEGDREQIIRKVQEIADAVSRSDLEAAFANVSEQFQRAGVNKAGFRRYAENRRRSGFVSNVQVWNLDVVELDRSARRAAAECSFKVHGSFGETPPDAFARIVCHYDVDGQWRVASFDWFSSIAESGSPREVPGWGGQ